MCDRLVPSSNLYVDIPTSIYRPWAKLHHSTFWFIAMTNWHFDEAMAVFINPQPENHLFQHLLFLPNYFSGT